MGQVKQGDTVRVHYTGRLEDGTVFESSHEKEPIEFTVGAGEILPAFQKAVEGMAPGEQKSTVVVCDEAYGPAREDLVMSVPRDELPPEIDPDPGDQLQMRTSDGRSIPVVVTEKDEEAVQIDANHPLAGEDLTFDIELVEIV